MATLDPVYIMTPLVVIAFSTWLVVAWHRRGRLPIQVLFLAFAAYAGAILLKELVQVATLVPFESLVGGAPAPLGLYFGLQTVVFEVGGAYLVAWYALRHDTMEASDAVGYGLSLAFWENGVLLGGTALLSFLVQALTLANGGAPAAALLANLAAHAPALLYGPAQALPLVGLAILERVSSLFLHVAWGLLVVLAAALRRPAYLGFALPMGLVDVLVPFAGSLGPWLFEGILLVVAVLCLLAALWVTAEARRAVAAEPAPAVDPALESGALLRTTLARGFRFGRVYLILGVAFPALMGVGLVRANGVGTEVLAAQLLPMMLPLFASLGAVGALMVFVSDRSRGVYEYLIAYGVSTYDIFWTTLLATLGLVTLVLVSSIVVALGLQVALGRAIQPVTVELIGTYTIPLSYASGAFMAMSGMVWSFLTARLPGVNSPVGLAPLLGMAPVLAVLLLAGVVGPGNFTLLTTGATFVLFAGVLVLMMVANDRMVRERLLADV